METEVEKHSTNARVMRHVSIFLTCLFFAVAFLTRLTGLSVTPASRPFLGLVTLLLLLSWIIFWQLRYGWVWMLILTAGLIALLFILGSVNSPVVFQLVAFMGLIAVSVWVSGDAKKRGMSSRWGFGVFLLAVVFLPMYFLVRGPVGQTDEGGLTLLGLGNQTPEALPSAMAKCTSCGHEFAASRSACEQCGQPISRTHSATA